MYNNSACIVSNPYKLARSLARTFVRSLRITKTTMVTFVVVGSNSGVWWIVIEGNSSGET